MSIYICNECNDAAFQRWRNATFSLSREEVEYLVKNIQHEYLNKDTYYFAVDLFRRMEKFLQEKNDELARRDRNTTQ